MIKTENAVPKEAQRKFRDMDPSERVTDIAKAVGLSDKSEKILRNWQSAAVVAGENDFTFAKWPVRVIRQITVNGVQRIAPMITEEASVVAAASRGAKMTERYGGFSATVKGTTTIGQVQVDGIPESEMNRAIEAIKKNEKVLIEIGNKATPHLVEAGGGILSINPKIVHTRTGTQLIVDFEADSKEAMGAVPVSKMAAAMGSKIEEITNGKTIGEILSNSAPGRLVTVDATFDKERLAWEGERHGKKVKFSGDEMVDRIVKLSAWADEDPSRAPTHNKGIMNGITAVAMATGQDTRAIEAAAHSHAARGGTYKPLSYFERDANGNLHGHLEVPIPVGVIGGTIRTNEIIAVNVEVTQVKNSKELAELHGAVGLAQNVSALRMLAGEGIAEGQNKLQRDMYKNLGDKEVKR